MKAAEIHIRTSVFDIHIHDQYIQTSFTCFTCDIDRCASYPASAMTGYRYDTTNPSANPTKLPSKVIRDL
ncbi:hypothetical protein D3C78_1876510 [compost metagenome]